MVESRAAEADLRQLATEIPRKACRGATMRGTSDAAGVHERLVDLRDPPLEHSLFNGGNVFSLSRSASIPSRIHTELVFDAPRSSGLSRTGVGTSGRVSADLLPGSLSHSSWPGCSAGSARRSSDVPGGGRTFWSTAAGGVLSPRSGRRTPVVPSGSTAKIPTACGCRLADAVGVESSAALTPSRAIVVHTWLRGRGDGHPGRRARVGHGSSFPDGAGPAWSRSTEC